MRYVLTAFLLFWVLASPGMAADITLGSGLIVAPGSAVPLPVSLTNAAPPGGVTLTLSSSDTSKVKVSPENVYVPGGSTVPYALPRVSGVSFGSATVSASAYGLIGSSQTVQVSAALSGPQSQSIQRGSTLNVMFALAWPTPSAISLSVRSDNPAVASVPSTATIPAGGTTAVIPIAGVAVGTTRVRVSALPDISESTVSVSVFSAGAITLSAVSLTLGQSLPFPVTLGAPSTGAGTVLLLTSSEPEVVRISPSSVFIPAGQTTPATQPEVTGGNIGAATITVSASGYLTASQQVMVTATITMSPTTLSIPVGGTQLLSMILSSAAPSIGVPVTGDRAAGGFVNGLTAQLSSSNAGVATVQPTVQFYSDGSSITTVVVVVRGVGTGTAVIHAGVPPFIPDTTATVTVGTPAAGPASLRATGGTPQTAQINTPFGLPLSVTALDAASNPVSGVTVTFTTPGGGPGAVFAGGVSTATTDASGVARSQTLTANGIPGTYQVTASAAGVAVPAAFTLTNAAAPSGAISLPSNLTVSPNQSLPLAVTLTAPAPQSGLTVTLTSSDSTKATISPSTVFIAGGAVTPASSPNITGINFGSSTIGASASGYASASQLVQVGATLSFSPASLAINGLGARDLTLTLSSPAPVTGLAVSLSSSNPGVATVAASATFPPNSTSLSVTVNGVGLGSATITATAGVPNVSAATAGVTVSSNSSISLAAGVKLAPGESAAMPVFLASPARSGGVFVALSSSDLSKVTVSRGSVYIPEGLTAPYSQPQVTGVSLGTAAVSASAYGFAGAIQDVQVLGKLSGPKSQTIQQGSTVNVMFVLSWPVPSAVALVVRSDDPAVARTPASVTIPANGSMAVVPVTAVSGGTTVIHVGALPDIAESTVSITVQAPGSITVSSGVNVALGESATFAVTLGAPAPVGGLVVTLVSSQSAIVSVSPSSVFIPAGATTPNAQPVVTGNNIGVATIAASASGYITASQPVAVTATIVISPATLVIPVGGTRLLGIALSTAAPSVGTPITPDRGADGFVEGLTVNLSSSNPGVATLQPTAQFYPDGSSITTVMVQVTGVVPGTAIIHASALPSIPDVTATVIVQ